MGLQHGLQLRPHPADTHCSLASSCACMAADCPDLAAGTGGVSKNAPTQHHQPLPSSAQVDPVHCFQQLLPALRQDKGLAGGLWGAEQGKPSAPLQLQLPSLPASHSTRSNLPALHPDSSIRWLCALLSAKRSSAAALFLLMLQQPQTR